MVADDLDVRGGSGGGAGAGPRHVLSNEVGDGNERSSFASFSVACLRKMKIL